MGSRTLQPLAWLPAERHGHRAPNVGPQARDGGGHDTQMLPLQLSERHWEFSVHDSPSDP